MSTPDQQHRVLALLRDCGVAMNALGQRFAAAADVHPTDLHALELLSRCTATPLTVGELAARLDMSSGAVTAVVDRLVRAGNVERVPDPDDRRRIRLRMTAQAHQLAQDHFGAYAARLLEVLADVPPEDLDRIAAFLDAARTAADDVTPP